MYDKLKHPTEEKQKLTDFFPLPGLSSPEGIAIDWMSGNMYWTDSGFDRIEVAKVDGSNRKILFDTDTVNPRGIAVDPING